MLGNSNTVTSVVSSSAFTSGDVTQMRQHPKLDQRGDREPIVRKRSNNNASCVESHQSGPSHKRKRNSHNNAAPPMSGDGAGITQMQLKLFSDGKSRTPFIIRIGIKLCGAS